MPMYPCANAHASVPIGRSLFEGVRRGAMAGEKWNCSCAGVDCEVVAGFELGKAPGPAAETDEESGSSLSEKLLEYRELTGSHGDLIFHLWTSLNS